MTSKSNDLAVPVRPEDHMQGGKGARVTLVQYGDYECPHCGRAYPIVKQLQERLGDSLRFVFRNFPLAAVHPNAVAAAEFAEAAGMQGKFWEAHDLLYEHQRALGPAHLERYAQQLGLDMAALEEALRSEAPAKRVSSDFQGGVRSGVNGTPTFFIDGRHFDGNWTDEEEFLQALG